MDAGGWLAWFALIASTALYFFLRKRGKSRKEADRVLGMFELAALVGLVAFVAVMYWLHESGALG